MLTARSWRFTALVPLSVIAGAVLTSASAAPRQDVLHTFSGGADGGIPLGVIRDAAGTLYGMTAAGGAEGWGAVYKLTPPTSGTGRWIQKVLYSFKNGTDGGAPYGVLAMDRKGALFGTTAGGGKHGFGVVFKLTPPASGKGAWKQSVLHSFSGGRDGGYPYAGVAIDADGALYGTTTIGGGGPMVCPTPNGTFVSCGIVYKLTPPASGKTAWSLTVLHRFSGGSDGAAPFYAGVVLDAKGFLYGTTIGGGNVSACPGNTIIPAGCGVVFKLRPRASGQGTWLETVLTTFGGGQDGGNPNSGVTLDASGSLFGTTTAGNATGYGTVFRLTPQKSAKSAWTRTILYRFSGTTDGNNPYTAGVVVGKNVVYGTTYEGGSGPSICSSTSGNLPCGVVYRLKQPKTGTGLWKETVLYSFTGKDDGAYPDATLVSDKSGALYGTTFSGGKQFSGVVFRVQP